MTAEAAKRPGGPWKVLADDSLSLALFGLFLVCLAAQSFSGWRAYDESLRAAHEPMVSYPAFLLTGTFQNAIFSNWQAAVLQLAVLVSFSSVLRQRGAAHSRKPAGEGKVDGPQGETDQGAAPRSQRADRSGRLQLHLRFDRKNWLWDNSLSLAMFALFATFFSLHAWTSNRAYNEEQALRHLSPQTLLPYVGSANLWFSTFETWEAEFFIIGLYVVMSVFLRQEHSPESKKPSSTDEHTGDTNE